MLFINILSIGIYRNLLLSLENTGKCRCSNLENNLLGVSRKNQTFLGLQGIGWGKSSATFKATIQLLMLQINCEVF